MFKTFDCMLESSGVSRMSPEEAEDVLVWCVA